MPGMSATVTVKIPTGIEADQVSVYLPVGAVVGGNDGGSFVWKVDSDSMTVSQAPVTVGQLSGSEVEIVDGLSTGDRIAVSGVQHLRDGMRIRELQN